MKKKKKYNLRDLWKNLKCTNISIIGVPENEDREKELGEKMEKITTINFPNIGKIKIKALIQVQKAHKVPYRINPRRTTKHILIKLTKIQEKDKILKAAREKQQITHKGIPIMLTD